MNQSYVVAVVALRVEVNLTFKRSPKACRLAVDRWSAMHCEKSDYNGSRLYGCIRYE